MKLYIVVERIKNGTVRIADLPDGALYVEKEDAIDAVKSSTNIPNSVVEISVVEFVENQVICTKKR